MVAAIHIVYHSFICDADFHTFAVKYINKHTSKTNIDSIIGQTGRVIAKIDNAQASGYVTVNGVEWAARSVDGSVLDIDTMVCIKAIEGVKLIVEPVVSAAEENEN